MICRNVSLPNQSFDILTHISADSTGVEEVLLPARFLTTTCARCTTIPTEPLP
jgi:hypothetical protein